MRGYDMKWDLPAKFWFSDFSGILEFNKKQKNNTSISNFGIRILW